MDREESNRRDKKGRGNTCDLIAERDAEGLDNTNKGLGRGSMSYDRD